MLGHSRDGDGPPHAWRSYRYTRLWCRARIEREFCQTLEQDEPDPLRQVVDVDFARPAFFRTMRIGESVDNLVKGVPGQRFFGARTLAARPGPPGDDWTNLSCFSSSLSGMRSPRRCVLGARAANEVDTNPPNLRLVGAFT